MQLEVPEEKLSDFRRAVHYLHSRQFFCVGRERVSGLLRVLSNPSLRQMIEAHFDLAGYSFHYDEMEGWYGIVPRMDEVHVLKMTPTQTLVLLLLRVHWDRCAEAGDMDAKRQALTTFNDLWLHAEEVLSHEDARAPALPAERMLDMLRNEFKQKGIVDFGEHDPDTQNYELFIRPFITLLAGEDVLARLGRYLDLEEGALKRADDEADDEERVEASGETGASHEAEADAHGTAEDNAERG